MNKILLGAFALIGYTSAQAEMEKLGDRCTDLPTSIVPQLACDVWFLQNKLRTSPKSFLRYLAERLDTFEDDSKIMELDDGTRIQTKEGAFAYKQAIQKIRTLPVRHPLDWSDGLFLAAKDHCDENGEEGLEGHESPDGTTMLERVETYVDQNTWLGENLIYGFSDNAIDIVMKAFVDDGVANRGHRRNQLFTKFTQAAVSVCEFNGKAGKMLMTVTNFAGDELSLNKDGLKTLYVYQNDFGMIEQDISPAAMAPGTILREPIDFVESPIQPENQPEIKVLDTLTAPVEDPNAAQNPYAAVPKGGLDESLVSRLVRNSKQIRKATARRATVWNPNMRSRVRRHQRVYDLHKNQQRWIQLLEESVRIKCMKVKISRSFNNHNVCVKVIGKIQKRCIIVKLADNRGVLRQKKVCFIA